MGAESVRVAGFGRLEDGAAAGRRVVPVGAVCERTAVGTVRENYSADGNAWDYLPHDHARSRTYRWGEDAWPGSATSSSACA